MAIGQKNVCGSDSAGSLSLGTFDANCVLPFLLKIQIHIPLKKTWLNI